jgi:dTDP-glucose 4,6-dehydratase
LSNKKVLVTGADGFIGSHLAEELVRQGYQVRAFVYYNSFNSWGWLDHSEPEIRESLDVFSGDIRDPHGIKTAMKGCEVVFHLAALISIPYSYHSPDTYIDTNVKGTLNVLQAARELGTEKVIHTSTSEVYGTAQYVPIDEKHPLQGQSPYSASKIGADKIAESFYLSFNLPVTTIRPFNTFGPRQSARAVIPTIISQALAQDQVRLGSLTPVRDLTFVKDTVRAFIDIAESDATIGQVVNVGTGIGITIGELAEKILTLIGRDVRLVTEEQRIRPQKSEVMRLLCDNSKMQQLTGWQPCYSLDEGVRETITWMSDHLDLYKPDIYNI